MRKQETMDGNHAAAHVAYAFTEVSSIYPITPSSTMAEYVDEWSAGGRKNIFGQEVSVVEMQSEAGAAGALHGALAAGSLATTFTASQGLLLMIPNMYKMAGELLPAVIHVSARAIATHALSIFGDHSDVMCCNQTGFAMIAADSVQEVMDLGAVAHLAAIAGSVPVLHFFDGFRTSHEQQKIEVWDYETLAGLLDYEALEKFRKRSLNPERPMIKGSNQNPDIFFQAREAANPYYQKMPHIIKDYMDKINHAIGGDYKPFNFYGSLDATDVIVCMGSVCETVRQVVDDLVKRGRKVGMVKVHLYRPFLKEFLFDVLPKSVRRIAVLDRVKVPGALGEPLYQDMQSAFYGQARMPLLISGRYGLGSKDTEPGDIMAVFSNLASFRPKNHFTLSIVDDVSFASLPREENYDLLPEGTIQCKFWGLGSDGTVGANKQAVAIINEETSHYAQAYFAYDSKKSGGLTVSHLRFGQHPIKAPYLIKNANFISCGHQVYLQRYDVLAGLNPGGTFLLNTTWAPEEIGKHIPPAMKSFMAKNDIQFYIINAVDIAKKLGLGVRTNMIMQAAFFKLAKIIPEETAKEALRRGVKKAYASKGNAVLEMNYAAIDEGMSQVIKMEVPPQWSDAKQEPCYFDDTEPEFVRKLIHPMAANKGDSLPVSAFAPTADGAFPPSGSRYEKRGVSCFVPEWLPENCIQCNRCALVCPHAAIRPFLLTDDEVARAPEEMKALKAVGKEFQSLNFRLQLTPLDCQGCAVCVEVCPAGEKALQMKHVAELQKEVANWEYVINLPNRGYLVPNNNIKNTQFKQPFLEFSGACAGCGETPYAKLVTQLFGERMIIANATGCSSIWGGAAPAMPYCTNSRGHGPAWSNSLFEDNAEFAFGIATSVRKQREHVAGLVRRALTMELSASLKQALENWLAAFNDADASQKSAAILVELLAARRGDPLLREIYNHREFLVKKSVWAFGGDGWAYDIGYGGVDHVLSRGEDINILVYDTEVYSNTGGQASKSTPTGAVAKFANSGKRFRKKDLGMMGIAYGDVYVAQIAMGADMSQALKAIREAEAYPGTSIIIAYSSCINHGIKPDMSQSMREMAKAVDCGYWHLYRYNPALRQKGENPFLLDSKPPQGSFDDFLRGEVRYSALVRSYPEIAAELFVKTKAEAQERYENYLRLAKKD